MSRGLRRLQPADDGAPCPFLKILLIRKKLPPWAYQFSFPADLFKGRGPPRLPNRFLMYFGGSYENKKTARNVHRPGIFNR
jgi:hypothetical protein